MPVDYYWKNNKELIMKFDLISEFPTIYIYIYILHNLTLGFR